MADTVTLTDHDAIRDWAAARIGFPAIVDTSAAIGNPAGFAYRLRSAGLSG